VKILPLAIALATTALAAAAGPANAVTAFVSNEKDNTVTVIDVEKQEVIKTIKVGQRPRGIILTKDHKWILVCTSDDNPIVTIRGPGASAASLAVISILKRSTA